MTSFNSMEMRNCNKGVRNDGYQRSGEDWQAMEYPVCLDWTPCRYGGERVWFLCPARGCGRRVAILYGGSVFACRDCHALAYPSQREAHYDRKASRADKIREKLGWPIGILNPTGGKPKGMHWKTYRRLSAEHDAFADVSLAGIAEKLGLKIGG